MLRLHRIPLTILIVCAVALPISPSPAQNDTPTSVTVTTSDGTKFELTSAIQAHAEWNTYEEYLDDAEDKMDRLKYEADVLQIAADGDESGLRGLAMPVALAAMLRKRADVIAVTLLIDGILRELIGNVKLFKYKLQLYDKWGEIEAQNAVLATAFADRDLFWNALAQFEGNHRKKQNQTSLADMQGTTPPFAMLCLGECSDWYYNTAYLLYVLGNPGAEDVYVSYGSTSASDNIDDISLNHLFTGVTGVHVATSELSSSALSHHATCEGCSDPYWTCRPAELKEHQVLYCGLEIELYFSVPYTPSWTKYA